MTEDERVDLHERLAKLEKQVEILVKLVEKMDTFIDKWKTVGVVFMVIGGGFVFILDHWSDFTKVLARWLAGH